MKIKRDAKGMQRFEFWKYPNTLDDVRRTLSVFDTNQSNIWLPVDKCITVYLSIENTATNKTTRFARNQKCLFRCLRTQSSNYYSEISSRSL